MLRVWILTLILLTTYLVISTAVNSPLVIIPGLTEAQLESRLNKTTRSHPWCIKNKDWHPIWFDGTLLLPPNNECFLDNLQLIYDNETRTSSSPEGVEIRALDYGGLGGLNYYDVNHKVPFWVNLTEPLINNYSYVEGHDLFGAPYDWRYGPNHYIDNEYPQLVKLIEYAYNQTQLPVVLISVSMGGPYTALFLNLQSAAWKATYIRGWVSLSSVLSGSSVALTQLVTNDPTGHFRLVKNIDAVSKSFPSIPWLMPSDLAFDPDRTFAITPEGNYSISNFTQLFSAANATYPAGDLYSDVLPFTNYSAPQVEVFCVWGYNISTPDVILISDDFNNATSIYGDGDNIVLVESLSVCSNEVWGKQQKQPLHTIPQANIPHAGQLETPEGVEFVIDIIVNQLGPVNN